MRLEHLLSGAHALSRALPERGRCQCRVLSKAVFFSGGDVRRYSLRMLLVSFLRCMVSAMVQAVFPVRAFSSLDGYWPTFMLIAYGEPHEQPESYSSVG